MKLADFIKADVELSLNLANEISLDMEENRRLCLKEINQPQKDVDGQAIQQIPMDAIRLGMDFTFDPTTSAGESPYDANREHLYGCRERVVSAFENVVNRLLPHYAERFIRLAEVEGSGCTYGVVPTEGPQEFCEKLITEVQDPLFSAYVLGTYDGFEHGQGQLRTMLGRNPASAIWYPYIKFMDEDKESWDHRNRVSGSYEKLPVGVESPEERAELFGFLLQRTLTSVESLEAVTLSLVKFRLRLFFVKGKAVPVDLDSPDKLGTLLCTKIADVVEGMYNMGFFNGIEEGQAHVKKTYSRYRDDKTYTLLGNNKSQWVFVDTMLPVPCDCSQCPRCVSKAKYPSGLKLSNIVFSADHLKNDRSEERRVGKECDS